MSKKKNWSKRFSDAERPEVVPVSIDHDYDNHLSYVEFEDRDLPRLYKHDCFFSIYDLKTHLYGPLMQFPNSIEALRYFEIIVNRDDNPDSVYQRFPDDFEVRNVGDWDPTEGVFYNHDCPKSWPMSYFFKPVGDADGND